MKEKQFIGGHIFEGDLKGIKFEYDAFSREPDSDHFVKTPIENGEILVSEERFSDEKFFMRVNGIAYGGNSSMSLEMAREHTFFEKNKDIADEHETPGQLFKAPKEEAMFNIANCELLGVSKGDSFVSARNLPAVYSPVRKVDIDDFQGKLLESMGDLKLGNLRSGTALLPIEAGIFKKYIGQHIFITARTGGGKSNSMKVLLGAMLESKGVVAPLIFEPHGEYIRDLKRHPLAQDRLVFFNQDGRDGDRKIKISYRHITVDILKKFRKQMNWTEPQERFIALAAAVLGQDWFQIITENAYDEEEYMMMFGKAFEDGQTSFEDFIANGLESEPILIRDRLKSKFNQETVVATLSKLRNLAKCPFLVKDHQHDDLDNILHTLTSGKGVLIDMASISGGMQELFLSTLLTNAVLKHQEKRYQTDREGFESGKYPAISIVLEECQRVLGKDGETDGNVFRTVVNEGRKFLTGLIGITQQAKLIDPIVLSQMNTHIILGISDDLDFEVLKGKVQKNIKNLEMDIKALMPGEAIISCPDSPFALPIKIYFYDDYIELVKKRMPTPAAKADYSLF